MLRSIKYSNRNYSNHSKLAVVAIEANDSTFLTVDEEECLNLIDVASGYVISSNNFGFYNKNFTGVAYSINTALFYNSSTCELLFFNLALGNVIKFLSLPNKTNQRIISVSASAHKEGLYFIATSADINIYCLSYNFEEGDSNFLFSSN